jgi:hypothetical protein
MLNRCSICNKEFLTYPSRIKTGRGKFCSKECSLLHTNKILATNGIKNRFVKGKPHPWHSHRSVNHAGYIEIYSPEHPNGTNRGYVREHRLIMESNIGRYLNKSEDVHHINGDKKDNKIENLMLMSHSEHTRINNPVFARWSKKEVVPNVL